MQPKKQFTLAKLFIYSFSILFFLLFTVPFGRNQSGRWLGFPWPGSSALGAPMPLPSENYIRFANIGGYGLAAPSVEAVAGLIKSWQPAFIVTNGDNNYPYGAFSTIDNNIGQYFYEYIHPYSGNYGAGALENRFFPALGESDWAAITCEGDTCSGPYFYYFVLPNNERYYDVVKGPVHLFVLDSYRLEPSNVFSNSVQADWLRTQLAASTTPWNIVIVPQAPYSSSAVHGSNVELQWPFQAWGADAVISGNAHLYERLFINGLPYFVNGLGGTTRDVFAEAPTPGSVVRYAGAFGALQVEADERSLTFQFITVDQAVVDTYTLQQAPTPTDTPSPPSPLPTPTNTLLPTVPPVVTATVTVGPTCIPTTTVSPIDLSTVHIEAP